MGSSRFLNLLLKPSKTPISFYRPIHTTPYKTHLTQHDPVSENIIISEAERITRLISTSTSSPIETLLANASIELSPSLVAQILRNLNNAAPLALSFFRWSENQPGFRHSTETYNTLIESLGKIKQFKTVWELVNSMKSHGLLTRETFALISRRYARAKKLNEALKTFEKMERFGIKIEGSDFNRLIDNLCKSRQVEKAQEVFDEMKQRKRFEPDVKSYTILLEGWGQERNFLRLDEVYREMKAEGFEADVVTYGILINSHCKAKRCNDAIGLFKEMEAKNVRPSAHVFCMLINVLGGEKRLGEALDFFERFKASGLEAEAPTYNAVVGAYCWSMRFSDAFFVVDEMRKYGIGPNTRTYDIILHHLVKHRRTEQAYSIFQRMSSERGCEPTVSTYEILLRMFCNENRVDMALKVWNEMKAKGVLPGMHMFSTLINSLCHEDKLDEACKYLQEMLDAGIRPPRQLFSNVKQALLDDGRKDDVINFGFKIDKLRKNPIS